MQSCYQGISPVSLRKILPSAELFGGDDYTMLNGAADVEKIHPGDVFFALSADSGSCETQIQEAVARGAGAIVSQEMTSNPFKTTPEGRLVPFFLVESAQSAYARSCQALYRFPARQMYMVGITGTSGKTTTAFLAAAILGAAQKNVGLLNSLGCFDGMDASGNSIANLPPKRTGSWLSRMQQNDCSHAVVEVSSQALDQSRLEGIDFNTICVTNIMRAHLDFHGSIDNYRKAKMRIFEYLDCGGTAVLNADDPIVADVRNWLRIPALTFGISEPADVSGMVLEQCPSEQTILLSAGGVTLPLRTRIVGNHYIYDCLAAAALGLQMEIDLPTIVRGIESVDSIPGRMERIECGQPFSVFVDAAHTPEELKSTLLFLREVVSGRILTVFGTPGTSRNSRRNVLGEIASRLSDHLILSDCNPENERPETIIEDVLKGVSSRRMKRVEVCHSRSLAIEKALDLAEPGDCVVIAGKGSEKFQLVGQNALRHDDREIAKRWLFENAGKFMK